MKEILVVAGEASADLHASYIIEALRKRDPSLCFCGVGGERLKKAGMDILVDSRSINLVGLTEVFSRAGELIGSYRKVQRYIKQQKPAAAILVDLPDFNLRIAKTLKKNNIPVLYYISPQVWAWRSSRIEQIRERVGKMLVLFDFEKTFYEKHNIPVEFVGHPFVDEIQPRQTHRPLEERIEAPRIALLPGSRKHEIERHGPILSELITRIKLKFPRASFRLPVASTISPSMLDRCFKDPSVQYSLQGTQSVAKWADIAVVTSGTAVLEVSLTETPLCLLYRASRGTAFLLRKIFHFDSFVGITNLLMNKEVVKEYLQEEARADLLEQECIRLLSDEAYRTDQLDALQRCRTKLGDSRAIEKTTEAMAQFLSTASSGSAKVATLPSHA